jgi:DNA replication protein DnaC
MRAEELICQVCNRAFEGEVSVYQLFGQAREIRPRECPECRKAREATERRLAEEELQLAMMKVREGWRRSCGIPSYLQQKTFANFDRRFQRGIVDAAEKWVETFLSQGAIGCPSLIFYSEEYGVGKTHVAVAISNRIIDSWSGDPAHAVCPIRFESGPGLVRRIRATYNIRDDHSYHETEEEVYEQLRGVKLLILDDVGKERPSVHTREVYFYIIDERLKLGLPVIITSNLPLEGENSLEQLMGEATVSRLIGMCQGNYFKLKGDDFRRRELKP